MSLNWVKELTSSWAKCTWLYGSIRCPKQVLLEWAFVWGASSQHHALCVIGFHKKIANQILKCNCRVMDTIPASSGLESASAAEDASIQARKEVSEIGFILWTFYFMCWASTLLAWSMFAAFNLTKLHEWYIFTQFVLLELFFVPGSTAD